MKRNIFNFICFFCLLMSSCKICENEIKKSENIDGYNKIVLFSRDAGATTGKSLQISIIPSTKELGDRKGNVCITDGTRLDYKIDGNNINIFYSGFLYLKKERFGNYNVNYIALEQ
ncbi:hypothetical protein [Treponema sp.]|uniref:hypothetical protein n=1 Tax=Treponema sp. TaxID=166 RepID=UPI00298DA0A7|nr:hypothetical protein [Treponema sp.]